jgi:hypothetical protein
MNDLSHFVYNHDILGLPVDADFALGVALPDIWPRFSRARRLRWKAVRAAAPPSRPSQQLQAGLLNHVEADQRFHVARPFLTWQRALKDHARRAEPTIVADLHPMVLDFLTHVTVEITLDHVLLRRDPQLAERYYAALAPADPPAVARRAAHIGQVDTHRLEDVIATFMQRRFLARYTDPAGLAYAVSGALGLTSLQLEPPAALIDRLIAHACELVDPATVWRELNARPAPAAPESR